MDIRLLMALGVRRLARWLLERTRPSRGCYRSYPARVLAWEVADTDVHVVPLDDLIEHEPNDCVCHPNIAPRPRDDGSMGWLYTHHSLDNREARRASAPVVSGGLK